MPLLGGLVAIVDGEDFDLASSITEWRVAPQSTARTIYVVGGAEVGYARMHRWLCGLTRGDRMVAHHLNGNGLDNRRSNLLVMTIQDHMRGHCLGTLFPPKVYRRRVTEATP